MKAAFVIDFIVFYIFFFLRAIFLSLKVKKNIKANTTVLNCAVLCAGLSAVLFILSLYYPNIHRALGILCTNAVLPPAGLVIITAGLLLSVVSSINLGNSWRIGVDDSETTELITSGMYRFSRNPYFTSYDIVLAGTMIASATVVVSLVSIATMVLFHVLIIKEEKYLEQVHKEVYREYKKKVRRYV